VKESNKTIENNWNSKEKRKEEKILPGEYSD
jgi:hypothetical protein